MLDEEQGAEFVARQSPYNPEADGSGILEPKAASANLNTPGMSKGGPKAGGKGGAGSGKGQQALNPGAGMVQGFEGEWATPSPDVLLSMPADWGMCTTIMMRNIPNKYTQRMLFTEVNDNGFLGTFDFLYLPIDPDTLANRGYAFLNFIDCSFAWMFKMSYDGRKMQRFNSNKVVQVVPATLQGFDANHAHYASARVNRGDPAARPLFLRDTSMYVDDKGANRGRRKQKNISLAKSKESGGTGWSNGAGNGGYGGDEMFSAPAMCGGAGPGPGPMSVSSRSEGLVARFCPQCGAPIQPMFLFCPSCGESLAESMSLAMGQQGGGGGGGGCAPGGKGMGGDF